MKVLISVAQATILLHRLSVPDALADCLTNQGSPLQNHSVLEVMQTADVLAYQCEKILKRKGGNGTLSLDVFDNNEIALEVLRDAVEGSTWPYWIETLVEEGEMSVLQANAQRNAMVSLERKLQCAGLKDAKFPYWNVT